MMAFVVSAIPFALIGAALIVQGQAFVTRIDHVPAALPQAFGGRYLAMAAVLCALTLLREWRAVAVLLAVGAGLACLDAWLVTEAGGRAGLHLAVGAFSLVGAAIAYLCHRARKGA